MVLWLWIEKFCVFLVKLMSFLHNLSWVLVLSIILIYFARGGFKTK